MKIASTKQLTALNDYAQDHFNRCLDPVSLNDKVDWDGLHILDAVLIHEHHLGKQVDPHLRCVVLIKCKHTMVPDEVFLDVEIDQYEALPGDEHVSTLMKEFVGKWNETLDKA